MAVLKEVNAKKDTVEKDGVLDLLKDADTIFIASGKKTLEFDPSTADMEEVLKKATGRTGNLRAPTLRIGDTFFIGFNEELYSGLK